VEHGYTTKRNGHFTFQCVIGTCLDVGMPGAIISSIVVVTHSGVVKGEQRLGGGEEFASPSQSDRSKISITTLLVLN